MRLKLCSDKAKALKFAIYSLIFFASSLIFFAFAWCEWGLSAYTHERRVHRRFSTYLIIISQSQGNLVSFKRFKVLEENL